jgi:histidinol-phosphatase
MNQDLELALELAEIADEISLARFKNQDFKVETKPDSTPVTESDRAVEKAIKHKLSQARPTDSIIGEEFGTEGVNLHGPGSRTWIIDPIDGTANYMRQVPIWATLIALSIDGKPTVSVVSAPALGRRWWACPEDGSWTREIDGTTRKLAVSKISDLEHASMSYVSLKLWEQLGKTDQLMNIVRKVWRTRAFGDFWSYMLLAEGAIDFTCEHGLEIYDWAALVPIVEQAGGRITSYHQELNPKSSAVLASNGLLHPQILEFFPED